MSSDCHFFVGLLGTAIQEKQKKPGRPAGTPGLTYVVLNFPVGTPKAGPRSGNPFAARMIPAALSVENLPIEQTYADAVAADLKESGAAKVLRKDAAFSMAELRDANRTRALQQELGAEVVVGASLANSGEYLITNSVRADNAMVLGTSRVKLFDKAPAREVEAVVVGVTGRAYLRAAGSSKESPIRFADPLHAGGPGTIRGWCSRDLYQRRSIRYYAFRWIVYGESADAAEPIRHIGPEPC